MKTALNFLFPIRLRSGQAVFVSRQKWKPFGGTNA